MDHAAIHQEEHPYHGKYIDYKAKDFFHNFIKLIELELLSILSGLSEIPA